jgi:sulfur carrier protein ThiS
MVLMVSPGHTDPAATFLEFRRKIQNAELLSASMEKLLLQIGFSGRLSVVVNHGRILKSGYEEGYFTRRDDVRVLP